MAKKQSEGLKDLVAKQEPVSIQEITMQDWFAAFAMINSPPMVSPKESAMIAWEKAEAMMEERARRM